MKVMDALPNLDDFALDEQAILLGILFDQMPMGVAIFNRQQILLRCNPTWVTYTRRYSKGEHKKVKRGMPLAEMIPGNETVFDPLFNHLLSGETIQQEALRLESGEVIFYWDIAALPIIEAGQVASVLFVTVDATQRTTTIQELHEIAASLHASQERLNLVLEATNDGIWDWDISNDKVYYSPRWKNMLGFAEDEIAGSFDSWKELIYPDDLERALNTVQAYLNQELPTYQLEHRLRCKDGTYRWILAKAVALRDDSGRPYRMVGSHTDITEQKRVEVEIRRQNEYLAALNETALGIISRLDSSELLETVIDRAVRLVGAGFGWVYLLDVHKKTLEAKVGTGLYQRYLGMHLQPGEGLAGSIWLTGRPMAVEDYFTWSGRSEQFPKDPVGPVMGAPLRLGAEVIGVIGIAGQKGDRPYNQYEIDLLARFAQLASIALDNTRLYSSLQVQLEERIQMEAALRERVAFEQLISEISSEFINLPHGQIDQGISHALETLGKFVGTDRSYVFIFSGAGQSHASLDMDDGLRIETFYEWCAPAVEPRLQGAQNHAIGVTPWTIHQIRNQQVVKFSRIEDLPPGAQKDKDEFNRRSIQSLLVVPLVYQGSVVGAAGFDSVHVQRDWSEETMALLRVVSEIILNALEHKRAQAIQDGQHLFLELLATGGDFYDILHTLVQLIEEQWPGLLGLVSLLDPDGIHLRVGASEGLPKEYIESIEGLEIGPKAASCGTACYTRQRVIVEDITIDERWEGLRDIGIKFGLRACWSEPVLSTNGQVVGVFSIYDRQPRLPTKTELQTLESAAHLVGVAIQHHRAAESIAQAYQSLEMRVEERTLELAALNAISAVVSRSLDLGEILAGALEKTMQYVQMEHGFAYRLEPSSLEPLQQKIIILHQVGLSVSLDQQHAYQVQANDQTPAGMPLILLVDDYPQEDIRQALQQSGVTQVITVPLLVKEEPITSPIPTSQQSVVGNQVQTIPPQPGIQKLVGALVFGTPRERDVDEEELALLSGIGQQVSVAVENALLLEETQFRRHEAERRRQVAEGMAEILSAINSNQSLDETLKFIVSHACRLMGSDAGAILRFHPDSDSIRLQSTCGIEANFVSKIQFPLSDSTPGLMILRRQPTTIADIPATIARIAEDHPLPEYLKHPLVLKFIQQFQAVLHAPLMVKNEPYGTLTFYKYAPYAFSEEDIRLATTLADQAALAIETTRLRQQSERSAALAERNRLARELHDSVTQSLYSVTLYAEAANRLLTNGKSDEAAGHMRELRDTAQEALREMRLLIFELRPLALEKVGLVTALRLRLESVESRGGIQTELTAQKIDQLPFLLQEEVYQVATEALNNLLKHAHAQNVAVRLTAQNDHLHLEVSDDGIGFDLQSAEVSGGFGIAGMRERAQRLDGQLEIVSVQGEGTRIILDVPLTDPTEANSYLPTDDEDPL